MKLTQFTHGIKKLFTGNRTNKKGSVSSAALKSSASSRSLESKLTLSSDVLSKESPSTLDTAPENNGSEAILTTRSTKSSPKEDQDLGVPIGSNQRVWENSNGTLFTADTTLYGQVKVGSDGQFEAVDMKSTPKEQSVSQKENANSEAKPVSGSAVDSASIPTEQALHGQIRWNENGDLVYV